MSDKQKSGGSSPDQPDKPADKTQPAGAKPVPKAAAKPLWKRTWAIACASVVLLLFIGYFVVTSSAFITGFILPKAGSIIGAEVTAESVQVSPFSSVRISGLKVRTTGDNPVMDAQSVSAKYSLMAIIGGNIDVSEVTIDGVTLNVVQNADGSTNLDPIFDALSSDEQPPPSSGAPRLNVRNVSVQNVSARYELHGADGGVQFAKINDLSITLDQLVNGQPGRTSIEAAIKVDLGLLGTAHAALDANFDVALTQELMPDNLKGTLDFNVQQATGLLAKLEGFKTALDTDLGMSEIKDLGIRFAQNEKQLGEVALTGQFDPVKLSADLQLKVSQIDRNLLNLAFPVIGFDFTTTTVQSDNRIKVEPGLASIAVNGTTRISKFQLKQKEFETPLLENSLAYSATVRPADHLATLSQFNVISTHDGTNLLSVSLDQPLGIHYGGDAVEFTSATTLSASVNSLNLAMLRPFAGETVPDGIVELQSSIEVAQDLETVTFTAGASANRIQVKQGNTVSPALDNRLDLTAVVNLTKKTANVSSLSASSTHDNNKLITLALSQPLNLSFGDTIKLASDTSLTLDIDQFDLAPWNPLAGGALPEGIIRLSAKVDADAGRNSIAATYQGGLQQKGESVVDLSGNLKVALDTLAAEIKSDIDAHLSKLYLGPNSVLPPDPPISVAIALDGGHADNLIDLRKLDATVTRSGTNLTTAAAVARIGLPKQAGQPIQLQSVNLSLTPTERADNKLTITGSVTPGDKLEGDIKVTAKALDLTPLAEVAMSGKKPATTNAPASEPKAPKEKPQPEEEPAAIELPIGTFALDIRVGELYLRDIAVSNYVTDLRINGSKVKADPVSLTFNGAPITAHADLNLGVPGYEYDLGFNVDSLPIEPIVNSLAPDHKGRVKAQLLSRMSLKGKGITGKSLRANLSGNFSSTLTNATMDIVGETSKAILMPIVLVMGMPQLLEPPLNYLTTGVKLGDGKVNIQNFLVQSAAFRATTQGEIPIEQVLANSQLDLPVKVYLPKLLMSKLTVTGKTFEEDWVALPDFVSILGTLGAPETKVDRARIAGLGLKAITGLPANIAGRAIGGVGDVGKAANKVVGGIFGTLTGKKKDDSSTNKVDNAEQEKKGGLGGLFKKLTGDDKKEEPEEDEEKPDKPKDPNRDQSPFGSPFQRKE